MKEHNDAMQKLMGDEEVCDCYPGHCTNGEKCWCEPEIIHTEGSDVIIHKEPN